ncbi:MULTISPECIES: serine/threonine-protein kinase [unclassified Streptomyces]|uniref:serine/threonine-protein kinase n=1 Tax=unclassified Streptomyces TaxID=2593676 RepID=UPI000DBA1269|nr:MULTISPECIES: serine/threonine-protein kinase [unclassified Streptomyces]MYT69785.1 PQQ-binding-like beta-propeller repeat protein [Streptomyces sp. SID8367]RAJ88357.1 serine/threonine protein kinase [Streptomyces sp. PsTaAH-137]
MPPLRSTGPGPEAERPGYAGRYRLEECLGTGGMGVVHLATSASGLRLAVKIVHAHYAADPEFRARFRQEVSAARRVSGAFTAPVVDADPGARLPWMATLFIPGDTLAERVKRNGALDVSEVRRLGAGLAEALHDIHRVGVVHRDLKPSNVLLAADGPKVIDFGISRPVDSELRTETGKLIGSPPFMAPEQFQRPREVGPAADVFAMGAVLAHAASGRGPFDSDSPYLVAYQVVHDEPELSGVPDALVPLIRRCLAKDPAERPSPAEIMDALRELPEEPEAVPRIPAQRAPDASERVASGGARLSTRSGRTTDTGTGAAAGRGRRSRVVLGASVGVLLVGGVAALATGALSPGGQEGPARSGLTASATAFTPWSVRLDSSGGNPPACLAGGGALYCVTDDGVAARLDPADGRVLWRFRAGGKPQGPSALSGGLLHVVADGRLTALDPRTGKARWTRGTAGLDSVEHSADTTLLVAPDGTVRALDSATGRQRWARSVGEAGAQWMAGGADTFFRATPTADGSATTVGAVSAKDGRVTWSTRASGYLRPVAAGDDALHLLSLDLRQMTDAVVRVDTGTHAVHRVAMPVPVDQAQAAESGGTVYVYAAGGLVYAVDTRPGTAKGEAVRWQRDTSVSRPSRPVAAGGSLYYTATDGRLIAASARTGAPLAQTRPRPAPRSDRLVAELPAPVVIGGKVYAGAPDGSVFGMDGSHPEDW